MSQNQADWSRSIQQAKKQIKNNTRISIATQKKEIISEIEYQKEQLFSFAKQKDLEKTSRYFNLLINNRAKLAALSLEEIKQKNGSVTSEMQIHISQSYQKDAIRIATATDALLGIKHEL